MVKTDFTHHPVITEIQRALQDTNARLFVVGGPVRDNLLNRPIKDIDVVVTGLPLDQLQAKLEPIGQVDLVGKRFAVLKLTVPTGSTVDVALPRTDASFGTGRYRDVEVRSNPNLPIEADLKRRDFTINAMAWDVQSSTLIDPHDGQADLSSKTIRAVGRPDERFQEDATRMLRAIRFAAQLDFTIESKTVQAIHSKLPLLLDESITPREVVAQELIKGFVAAPVRMFDLLDQLSITKTLLPELTAMKNVAQPPEFHAEGDVWTHTRIALSALEDSSYEHTFGIKATPAVIVTTLLHDIGKPPTQKTPERDGANRIRFDGHAPIGANMARAVCKRLKLDSTGEVDCEQLHWVIHHHMDSLNLEQMRLSTIERTFLDPPDRGRLHQQLFWADGRASLEPAEAAAGKTFHQSRKFPVLLQKLEAIRQRGYQNNRPKPLLDGNEVMKLLKLKPGPKVGELLEVLRDAQLEGRISTPDEAASLLKKHA